MQHSNRVAALQVGAGADARRSTSICFQPRRRAFTQAAPAQSTRTSCRLSDLNFQRTFRLLLHLKGFPFPTSTDMSSTSKPPEIMTYEDMWSEAIPEYYNNAGYTSKEAFCRDHQRVKKQIEESVQPQESSSGHGSIFWALASTSVQVGGQAAALVSWTYFLE